MKKICYIKIIGLLTIFAFLQSNSLFGQTHIDPDPSISYNPFNSFDECSSWSTEYVEGGYFYCGDWEVELFDGFEGESLNEDLWSYYFESDNPLYERLHTDNATTILDESNVHVEGGRLFCETKWENPPISWQGVERNKSSGLVHSTKVFNMGYYEIRCKLPANAETPAAFWMWHHDELDVIDSATKFWYTNQMISSPLRNSVKVFPFPNEDMSTSHHNYSMEWDPYSITYRRDGVFPSTATFYKYYDENGDALQVKCGEMVPSGYYRVNPAFPKRERWFAPIAGITANLNATQEDLPAAYEVEYILMKERTLEKINLSRTNPESPNQYCVDPCESDGGLWVNFEREQLNFFRLDDFELDYNYIPNYTITDWTHSSNIQIVDQIDDAIKIEFTNVIGGGGNSVASPFWVKATVESENGSSFEVLQNFGYFDSPETVVCESDPCSMIICVNPFDRCIEDIDISFSNPNYVEVNESNGMTCFEFDIIATSTCITSTMIFANCDNEEEIVETHCPTFYKSAFSCSSGEEIPLEQSVFIFAETEDINWDICFLDDAIITSAIIISGGGYIEYSGNSAAFSILPHQYNGPISIEITVELCGISFTKMYQLIKEEGFNDENNNQYKELYTIYPVPTYSIVNVLLKDQPIVLIDNFGEEYSVNADPEYIEVRDLSGNIIQRMDCTTQTSQFYQIDLGNQQEGIYHLFVKDNNLENAIPYIISKI